MAVFQQNLGFSTIQAKQLSALESLNDSFERGLSVGKDIYDRVDVIPDTILRAAGAIIQVLSTCCSNNSTTTSNIMNSVDNATSALTVMEDSIQRSSEDLIEHLDDFHEDVNDDNDDDDYNVPGKLDDLKDAISGFLTKQLDFMADSANEWSKLYNDTIKYIGTDRENSQAFRRDIVNQVDTLNADLSSLGDLGAKLDPQEAMRTMVAIADSANISNTETLKALTTPILLAQETTNVNTSELAKLGTRLYTRYGFSSTAIEDLVDQIRNTSEGQNIDEDVLLDALNSVESRLGLMFEGDEESIKRASDSFMKGIGWLQSQGMDSTMYAEDIKKLMSEDPLESHSIELVKKYGDVDELISLLENFSFDEAIYDMATSMSQLDATFAGQNLGVADEAESARLWAQAVEKGTGQVLEDWKASIDEDNTARERASDKQINLEEQMNNILKGLTSRIADFQEATGIGLSDILLGVTALGSLKSLIGGSGGSILGGKGLAGLLMTPQGLAIGAGIAALAVVVTGISNAYKEVNKDKMNSWGDLGEGTSSDSMEYYWTSSMDSDGNVNWSMTGVDTSQFSEDDLEKFHKTQEQNSADYEKFIESQSNLTGWGKFWNWFTDVGFGGTMVNTQKGYKELLEEIANLATGETYGEMVNEYIRRGLLDTTKNKTLEGFINNIDEYLDLYEEGKIAEVNRNGSPGSSADMVNSYATGTNYVNQDQLAYIHEGEAITPARYNPAANMNELERLREENDNSEDLNNISDTLSDIREFLDVWKKDSEKLTKSTELKKNITTKLSYLKYNTAPTTV